MEELGIITSILSRSPQSRGRIEKLWGTFQDRLTSELRLAGANTIREANQVLWDFLPRYSQRFAVPAVQHGSAYHEPGERFIPDEVFCFKYYRRVGPDNVVRFGEHRLQIMPTNGRSSYARAIPGMTDSDELAMPIIAVKKTPQPKIPHRSKPGPDYPWRRPFKVHIDRG